jgi:hypothetical protein
MIVWFAVINTAAERIKPLRHVTIPNLILSEQDPLGDKYAALVSPNESFNVLVLGSSLVMATAGADIADGLVANVPSFDAGYYTRALALDRDLKTNLQVETRSFNMGITACMLEEDLALLQQALRAGKRPRVVLLMVAPRDFIDKMHKRGTHVEQYIASLRPWWQQVSLRNSVPENIQALPDFLSYVYKNRGQYLQVLDIEVCNFFHRPATLYDAVKGINYTSETKLPTATNKATNSHQHQPKREGPQTMYPARYLPIDYRRFSIETVALDKILQTCNQNNIIPIVVNMPRTRANEALLPESFRALYRSKLQESCSSNTATLFDYGQDAQFTDDDFTDTVHLTPAGASKLFKVFAGDLAQSQFATAVKRAL